MCVLVRRDKTAHDREAEKDPFGTVQQTRYGGEESKKKKTEKKKNKTLKLGWMPYYPT